jgi:phosphoribosylanthranilate isomerase
MTWIKICGLTTPDAVAAALSAGADALGFVFAESPRRVSSSSAAQLAAPARGRALCTAVMRHPTQQMIDEVLNTFRPDMLQTDMQDLRGLRLPRQLRILPVLRALPDDRELPDWLLFEGSVSGSGTLCDWQSACAVARKSKLVLAGGLNAANVSAAVTQVQPFGVDVSTGVEERPGVKSPAEIARFVAAVRATVRNDE